MVFAQDGAEPLLQVTRSERRALLEEEALAIQREQRAQKRMISEVRERIEDLTVAEVTEASLRVLQRELENTRLQGEDLRIAMGNSRRRIAELQNTIRAVESRLQLLRNPAQEGDVEAGRVELLAQAEQELALAQESLDLEALQRQNQQSWLEINASREQLLEESLARRTELYNQRMEGEQRKAQDALAGQLRERQRTLLSKTLRIKERLVSATTLSAEQRQLLMTHLRDAEERSSLLQLDIRLAALKVDLLALAALLDNNRVAIRRLEIGLERLQAISSELQEVNDLLARKAEFLSDDLREIQAQESLVWEAIQVTLEREEILSALLQALDEHQLTVQSLAAQTSDLLARLQQRYNDLLNSRLFSRQQLPRDGAEWATLLHALSNSPGVLWHQARLSLESLFRLLGEASVAIWTLLGVLGVVLCGAGLLVRRSLLHGLAILRDRCGREASFTAYTLLTLLLLLQRNLWSLLLVGFFAVLLWQLPLPWPGVGILLTLLGAITITRLLLVLTGLLLASPDLPIGTRPVLYRDVTRALVVFSLVSTLVILVRLSSLSEAVVATYDRIFMVLLVLVLVPLMKIRRLVVDTLASRYAERRWFISLRIISLVFPLAVLVATVLGMAGYLLLAWTVGWHLVVLLLVIAAWLLIRGLLDDFTDFLKNWVMLQTRYGLLWTQDIINPTRRLVGVLLFLGMFALLLRLFQWESDSPLLGHLWRFSEATLLSLGGTDITPRAVVVTAVLGWAVLGMARWTRNVTYRWIFSGVIDLGVRNSLSVFTQYAVVIIGFLMGLHALGLNLSSLALFAGAVGVGIGFGLQTVANNFISGLLLLIERPLRSGDTVQIGTNLGTIERIGIRSLTMKTWDNTDVIIPNADVISNAFTNWTHSDNVIRTLFFVPVPVDSDPHQVGALMRQVVTGHADVLRDPEPLVVLWEFGKSAITFRVQYYTDFFQSHLLKVQSDIMYGIYDQLKAAGIPIQINEQGVRIRAESAPLNLLRGIGDTTMPMSAEIPDDR